MVISRSQMQSFANNIEDKSARLSKINSNKVVGTNKETTTQENTAVFNALKQTLESHYTPQIAREAMETVFNTEDLEHFDLAAHVKTSGMTGDDIARVLGEADDLRKEYLSGPVDRQTATKLIMNKLDEEIVWPNNLNNTQKALVRGAVEDVVNKFAGVHGTSADKVAGLIAKTLAQKASDMKRAGQSDQISNSMKATAIELKKAIVNDSLNAAINGDHSMGNVVRALAPKLSMGKTDYASVERGLRFAMVKDMVGKMPNTNVSVTVKQEQKDVDLKSIFDPNTNVWKDLSSGDREKAVKAFMKLHAQTHGYQNNVELKLNQSSDSAERNKMWGTKTMNLRAQTMESNDPTLIFKTLSHELTHSYQYSILDGTNQNLDKIPQVVKDRLDFDLSTRTFTKHDHHVEDFAHNANNYVRDFTERGAVESEWVAGQLLQGSNASLTDFVKVTKDLQDGMAGHIRMQEWTQSLDIQSNLASNAETQLDEVRNLTDAASTALEIGSIGTNTSYLKEGELLLNNIDFSGMSKSDITKFSSITVTDLSDLLGRVRSSDEAKLFARQQLPRFQLALAQNTDNPKLAKSTANRALSNMTELLKSDMPVPKRLEFLSNTAAFIELSSGSNSRDKVDMLKSHAEDISKLLETSDNKFHHDKALEVLQEMLDTAVRIDKKDRYGQNIQIIKDTIDKVTQSRDQLIQ
ncbi:hypothetical protein [Acanthopleuribacter pedis]|uniref:Uncharacterized protein n=1 Tax=Acanthopleuribacter pedis TaxID=442870 RepID=A0A8J7QBR8_9BACT|nr:hypothetical protein [Acanthopleuribacter pedis]MBO1322696.1 hypothetical protein [Acanthopleuribacter pedis]